MCTHNLPFYNKKENHPQIIVSYGVFYLRTQERVRNSRGKRAISVRRATEVLLYKEIPKQTKESN